MGGQCDKCGKDQIEAQLCTDCLKKFIETIKADGIFVPDHFNKMASGKK